MAKEIIVYSQEGCMPCEKVKNFLKITGRAFTEKDVKKDEQALAELKALNYISTPVTIVDGQAVVGFNIELLSEYLEEE